MIRLQSIQSGIAYLVVGIVTLLIGLAFSHQSGQATELAYISGITTGLLMACCLLAAIICFKKRPIWESRLKVYELKQPEKA